MEKVSKKTGKQKLEELKKLFIYSMKNYWFLYLLILPGIITVIVYKYGPMFMWILRQADSADDLVKIRKDDGPVVVCSLEVVFNDIDAVRPCAVRLPAGVRADVRRGGVFEEIIGVREIPRTDDGSGCGDGFHW